MSVVIEGKVHVSSNRGLSACEEGCEEGSEGYSEFDDL
jgi:hypothetical protein